MSKMAAFWIALGVAAGLGFGLMAYYRNANGFFSSAYKPIVQKAAERKNDQSAQSAEPRPAGLREREIKKHKGHRYSVY